MNKPFHYHTKLANENISVCCFSTTHGINIRRNRLKTGEKLTITSSITKESYIRPSILLFRHHRQCIRLYFGWLETQFFESKLGGWKDFMFRNNKFPDFVHPHNLFEYFQNKAIDSNNTFWKRQNTKGSIKKHCVKKSKYGIFSAPHFPVFRLSTGKYGPEKTPYLDSFHAVTTISQQRKQKILFLATQKERRSR